jgi:autoinducer 2-degrading protein
MTPFGLEMPGIALVSAEQTRYTAAHLKTAVNYHTFQTRLTARLQGVAMHIVMVRLKVKQNHIDNFIKASIADGTGSVLNEPGCRRFDIIQDETDPTLFAFNEVYNDLAAFEHHKTTPHFAQWDAAVKDMLDAPIEASFCRPVYPMGNANWDAYRPGAVEDPAFNSSLHVIHSPLPVQPDKVDAFIEAVTLDGLG